jgi:hypothetical protein
VSYRIRETLLTAEARPAPAVAAVSYPALLLASGRRAVIFRRSRWGGRRLPLARASGEEHLYMDLRPCGCGEVVFPQTSAVIRAGNDLASRYPGECVSCGSYREFAFRLPAKIQLSGPGVPPFGADGRSELLDPGEWLWIADRYASAAPADLSNLTGAARERACRSTAIAAAAMDEVLAFVPLGAKAVPARSIWSERGRAVHASRPGRFRRERLVVVRDTYRAIMAEQGSGQGER